MRDAKTQRHCKAVERVSSPLNRGVRIADHERTAHLGRLDICAEGRRGNMKNVMRILTAAALGTLALAVLPGAARADERQFNAEDCAIRYEQLIWSLRASEIISDYDRMLEQDRGRQLIETYSLNELMISMNATGTIDSGLVGSLEMGLDSDEPILVELAMRSLAYCDEVFGFTPVFALKTDPAISTAARQDLDCAADYRTLVSVQPAMVSLAIERSAGAIHAYKASPPPAVSGPTPVTDSEIIAEVAARSRPRAQRIAGGQENLSALVADVHACDSQYGHALIDLR